MKKETLEEAAENSFLANKLENSNAVEKAHYIAGFRECAKWQQETLSWDELVKEAGNEEELIKILKLPHIAPLVREAMRNNCKKK